MTFLWPLALALLVVLPLAAWGYLRSERGAGAEAFTSGPAGASVQRRAPGWRRHVGPLAALLALAVLLVAAARPQAKVPVRVEQASVVLVIDRSGSMQADDVPGGRMTAAKQAAGRFLDALPRGVRAGVVAFNQDVQVLQAPTTNTAAARAAIDSLEPAGSTAAGDALTAALRLLRPDGAPRTPAAIVLLTDGKSVRGSDPVAAADEARKQRVPISTIALGTDQGVLRTPRADGTERVQQVPPDRATLQTIAERSGGQSFQAATPTELSAIYERLGRQAATRREPREITGWLAGGALAILLLGGGASLALTGRVV